jgi:hypothetical protein
LRFFAQTALAADPPPASKPAAGAADATEASEPTRTSPRDLADEPATLRILNRDVVTLRARVGGLTPKLRVQRRRSGCARCRSPPSTIR